MNISEKKKKEKKRGLIKYNFRCQITRDGFHFLYPSLRIRCLQIVVVFLLGHRHPKSLVVIPPSIRPTLRGGGGGAGKLGRILFLPFLAFSYNPFAARNKTHGGAFHAEKKKKKLVEPARATKRH